MFESELYAGRRRRLVRDMDGSFLAIVPPSSPKAASADAVHDYVPNMDLVYLTGIDQQGVWLTLQRTAGGEVSETLFIPPYDETHAKWYGTVLTREEASEVSGVEDVRESGSVRGWIDRMLVRKGVSSVWVDFPLSGVRGTPGTRQTLAAELSGRFPHIRVRRLSELLFPMRMVKDEGEIAMIRRAIDLSGRALRRAMAALRPGMMEYEFEAEMLYEMALAGESAPAFPAIVAGGGRATCLHYSAKDSELEEGTMVLLDFGASWSHYSSDISRTLPVGGTYTPRQRELVEMVIEAQEEAIRLLRPGVLHSTWDREVKEAYADIMAGRGIIDSRDELERFFYHNIGHHIGLDTHDENLPDVELAPGMVLTVEPGFYSAEEGVGIRIEDDVMIGSDGNIVLSPDIPKAPDEVEAAMREARG